MGVVHVTKRQAMAIDYSSRSYWETRLEKEREQGFEWLVPSASITPIIAPCLDRLSGDEEALNILHFGCGSSSLGTDIQRHYGKRVLVYDADYASASISPRRGSPTRAARPVPVLEMDVLSLDSLHSATPARGWDLLIDKSTADAISCGTSLACSGDQQPNGGDLVQVLCKNLSQVVRMGGRWISVSYSSTRYDFLSKDNDAGWTVLERIPLDLAPTTTNSNHIVYHPPTGIWAWVLERVR